MSTPIPYLSQQPIDDFGLRFSNLKYTATVAGTTDTTLTVPGNAQKYKAVITVETPGVMYVAFNTAASVPAGATFAASASELIGIKGLCREVSAGDVLHFYSGTADVDVGVVFYSLGTNN